MSIFGDFSALDTAQLWLLSQYSDKNPVIKGQIITCWKVLEHQIDLMFSLWYLLYLHQSEKKNLL